MGLFRTPKTEAKSRAAIARPERRTALAYDVDQEDKLNGQGLDVKVFGKRAARVVAEAVTIVNDSSFGLIAVDPNDHPDTHIVTKEKQGLRGNNFLPYIPIGPLNEYVHDHGQEQFPPYSPAEETALHGLIIALHDAREIPASSRRNTG